MGDGQHAQGLAAAVLTFARALRASHVAVSTAEVTDALHALQQVPLDEREVLRATLATTLVKDPSRRKTFDRLFDAYFPLRRSSPHPSEETDRRGRGDVSEDVAGALASGDDDRLRDLARDLVRDRGDLRPEAEVSESSYVFRALRGLNLDAIRHRLQDEAVEGRGYTSLQRRFVHEDLEEQMEKFRRMVHDEVFSSLLEHLGADTLATRDRRPPPEEVDFLWARESDIESMRAAIAPLARRLSLKLSHQRRRARRGRLDVRRTIRRSLSTGGVLVEPAFRRPAAGRPDLVLLCDISGSMRAFARFALELIYALATQFPRVRTFVFVDSVAEVTDMLGAAGDLGHAMARIDREADVARVDGQSWYGRCFEQFWEQAGRDLNPRTTVIVIGDARNNFRTTGVEALGRLRDQVRAVHWLNPEPRAQWDTGDSVIGEFVPACTAVYEVRNLRQLEAYVASAA